MDGIKSQSSYLWVGMVAPQVNAKLGTHLGIAVGVQHVGGHNVMEDGGETEFVYPMINAFPVVCGR